MPELPSRLFPFSRARARQATPVAGGMQLPQGASQTRRWFRLATIFLLVSTICGYLDRQDIVGFGFSYFDQYFYNGAAQLSARRNGDLLDWAKKQIVVVPISDSTFNPENPEHLLEGPPTPRDFHAKVLSDLKRAGAKVIVYDIVFLKPGERDQKFIQAATTGGQQVVWGALVDETEELPTAMLPMPALRQANPYYGHILSLQDERLVVQRVRSVYQLGKQNIPSLSLEACRIALGLQNEPLEPTPLGWRVGQLKVPETFNIQYLSGNSAESAFPTIPFEQLYSGAVDDPFYKENHFFKDKIIILGDITKLNNDFRNTPVGLMPGVEIQANAIATLLMAYKGQRALVSPISPQLRFGILLVMTAITCLLAGRFSLPRAGLGVAAAALAYLGGEIWLYVDHGLVLPTTAPLLAMTLASILVLMERGFWEEREKNYVRSLLGRYVSPSVADYMLLYPERCTLQGEAVEATVLFADLRNFTSMSQQLPPDVILWLLNDFFHSMSEIVFAHDGMVDKFIGDAIMAIFGAPVSTPDHARHAVEAAVEMLQRVNEMQKRWQDQGLPEIRIGIGIATGPMIVGNMGSEQRMDFSAVGNAVNLAARLQDMNKELGTQILISQECQSAVGPGQATFVSSEPMVVTVRGHQHAESIYSIEPRVAVS